MKKAFRIGIADVPLGFLVGTESELTNKYSESDFVVFTEGWQTISEYRRFARLAGLDKKIGYFTDDFDHNQPSTMLIPTNLTFGLVNGMYDLGKRE